MGYALCWSAAVGTRLVSVDGYVCEFQIGVPDGFQSVLV